MERVPTEILDLLYCVFHNAAYPDEDVPESGTREIMLTSLIANLQNRILYFLAARHWLKLQRRCSLPMCSFLNAANFGNSWRQVHG